MSAAEFDRMYREHSGEVVVIYTASAYDRNKKTDITKYGVCNHAGGMTCLPNQDFPLAGSSYKEARSKGVLTTSVCVAGCRDAPAAIHYMGYENMDGERNIDQEVALESLGKCVVERPNRLLVADAAAGCRFAALAACGQRQRYPHRSHFPQPL